MIYFFFLLCTLLAFLLGLHRGRAIGSVDVQAVLNERLEQLESAAEEAVQDAQQEAEDAAAETHQAVSAMSAQQQLDAARSFLNKKA